MIVVNGIFVCDEYARFFLIYPYFIVHSSHIYCCILFSINSSSIPWRYGNDVSCTTESFFLEVTVQFRCDLFQCRISKEYSVVFPSIFRYHPDKNLCCPSGKLCGLYLEQIFSHKNHHSKPILLQSVWEKTPLSFFKSPSYLF